MTRVFGRSGFKVQGSVAKRGMLKKKNLNKHKRTPKIINETTHRLRCAG